MKTITLAIEEDILDKARQVAAGKRTTVDALVREFLTGIAGEDDRLARARQELIELMDNSKGDMGPNWKFSREDSYDR